MRDMLKSQSGLVLSSDKTYLLESRLTPIARRRGVASVDDLVQMLRGGSDKSLTVEVTEAMTTNESFFFRDVTPFESFRDHVLPKLIAARKAAGRSTIRIWSAACSSGQEPYTLAMMLKEDAAKLGGMKIEIIGTDISSEIVGRAKAGIYSQFEVQRGLPVQLLVKYFAQIERGWEIDASLKSMVQYRTFNLLDSYTGLGRFDVVYCRNVLIYFDPPTKTDVLRRISMQLENDGVLYLGGAESVLGVSQDFKPIPGLRGAYGLVDNADSTSALKRATG